jgi:4-hydroxy-4-methyl-2-oxoglutarate aldolase
VVDFRVPVEIGTARVRPGDILFGDIDGVCLVPTEAAEEVFSKALEKVRGEKLVRKALEAGSSAVAAFEKHGIM